jgi:hypothetical protein
MPDSAVASCKVLAEKGASARAASSGSHMCDAMPHKDGTSAFRRGAGSAIGHLRGEVGLAETRLILTTRGPSYRGRRAIAGDCQTERRRHGRLFPHCSA